MAAPAVQLDRSRLCNWLLQTTEVLRIPGLPPWKLEVSRGERIQKRDFKLAGSVAGSGIGNPASACLSLPDASLRRTSQFDGAGLSDGHHLPAPIDGDLCYALRGWTCHRRKTTQRICSFLPWRSSRAGLTDGQIRLQLESDRGRRNRPAPACLNLELMARQTAKTEVHTGRACGNKVRRSAERGGWNAEKRPPSNLGTLDSRCLTYLAK